MNLILHYIIFIFCISGYILVQIYDFSGDFLHLTEVEEPLEESVLFTPHNAGNEKSDNGTIHTTGLPHNLGVLWLAKK